MRPGRGAWDLLEGAIDLHVHPSPSRRQRLGDAWEFAERAAARGMAGLLLKDHDRPTMGDAAIVTRHGPGPFALSSMCCNSPAGGLNVTAVEVALELGAAMVFLPTNSAANDRIVSGHDPDSSCLSAMAPDGTLGADVEAILLAAAARSTPVATGHLSAAEIDAVIARAAEIGLSVVVTHAPVFTGAGLDVLERWVAAGATLELSAAFCCGLSDPMMARTIEADAAIIEAVGAASVALSSDLGYAGGPAPADGFAAYLGELLAFGMGADALRQMTSANPRRLMRTALGAQP